MLVDSKQEPHNEYQVYSYYALMIHVSRLVMKDNS